MSHEQPAARPRRRRWPYIAGLLLFLGYAAWMLGPYLRSIVVRDAAVTTWARVANSPIGGTIQFVPLQVNGRVGQDGAIAYVFNEHATQFEVEKARIHVEKAEAEVAELLGYLDEIKALDEERQALKALYADIFRSQLDVRIETLRRRIEITRGLQALMRQISDRKVELASRGVGSQNDADEAQLRLNQVELELVGLEQDLAFVQVRRNAADQGIFTTEEGEDPAWVRGSRMELKLEKKEARLELRTAEAELAHAKAELLSAETDFDRLSTAMVEAPPGSLVWSQRVVSGMAVLPGDSVAEWLDCSVLLIDAPVSDVEASLVEIGQAATVVLEGERRERAARALVVRGSAATLGLADLVAVAKGRKPGTAQVLLELLDTEGFNDCPVGLAAYVDFPDVGLVDVLFARLRL